MFSKKKNSAEITPGEPQFLVRYVGKVDTCVAGGIGCTRPLVQEIWDNSPEERRMKRVSLLINHTGLYVTDLDDTKSCDGVSTVKFDIRNISYCCAEPDIHNRVFSWIYKDTAREKLFCHAVLCEDKEEAQSVAVLLTRAFQIAYRDWKNDQNKEKRKKLADQYAMKSQITLRPSASSPIEPLAEHTENGSTLQQQDLSLPQSHNSPNEIMTGGYCRNDILH